MYSKSPIIVGLTGGIATGKSTVANYLQEKYDFPLLDADILARDAVKIDSPIFQEIVSRYGQEILAVDGNLDRQKLGQIIFSNKNEKIWLESLVHPFVLNSFREQIKRINSQVIILAIPLLFEAKMTNLVTEIWVVACDFKTQLARLKLRNNLSEDDAIRRINNQMSLGEKIKLANVILDNNESLEYLYKQVDQIVNNRLKKIKY